MANAVEVLRVPGPRIGQFGICVLKLDAAFPWLAIHLTLDDDLDQPARPRHALRTGDLPVLPQEIHLSQRHRREVGARDGHARSPDGLAPDPLRGPSVEGQLPGDDRLEQRGLSGVVRPGEDDRVGEIEGLLAEPLEVPDRDTADHHSAPFRVARPLDAVGVNHVRCSRRRTMGQRAWRYALPGVAQGYRRDTKASPTMETGRATTPEVAVRVCGTGPVVRPFPVSVVGFRLFSAHPDRDWKFDAALLPEVPREGLGGFGRRSRPGRSLRVSQRPAWSVARRPAHRARCGARSAASADAASSVRAESSTT